MWQRISGHFILFYFILTLLGRTQVENSMGVRLFPPSMASSPPPCSGYISTSFVSCAEAQPCSWKSYLHLSDTRIQQVRVKQDAFRRQEICRHLSGFSYQADHPLAIRLPSCLSPSQARLKIQRRWQYCTLSWCIRYIQYVYSPYIQPIRHPVIIRRAWYVLAEPLDRKWEKMERWRWRKGRWG